MKIHLRGTSKGTTPVNVKFGDSSVQHWEFHQILMHCSASFTDVSTFQLYIRNHEGTAYDCKVLGTPLATVDGVLNDIFWSPENPIHMTGADRIQLVFAGASAAA